MLGELDHVVPAGSPAAPPAVLPLANLLNDLDHLLELLAVAVEKRSWLNAFLLAAGANQIVDDHLHERAIWLERVGRHLGRSAPRSLGGATSAAFSGMAGARQAVGRFSPADRRARAWRSGMSAVVDRLAEAVADPSATPYDLEPAIVLLCRHTAGLQRGLRRSVVRLPSCFRNFDQHPEDLAALTEDFCTRWPDRARPVAVVGVRTSGSYTGPLHAAMLRMGGWADVQLITFRPGQRWDAADVRKLDHIRTADGVVLVSDDAPNSGGSLARTAAELEHLGIPAARVIIAVQTIEPLPPLLDRYSSVVLAADRWSVRRRLEPEQVQLSMADMIAGTDVLRVSCLDGGPSAPRRGHAHAAYRALLRRRGSSDTHELDVNVRGVGIGYFGEHSLAVSTALDSHVPQVFGLRDGLIYEERLDERRRLPDPDERLAEAIVNYTMTRSTSLRVPEDVSLRLEDRGAVWQRAADVVARSFGRAAQLFRPLTYPIIRHLLRVERPSVIDGDMATESWFASSDGFRKAGADSAAFSSLDVYCYDHVFDLACCDQAIAPAVRRNYEHKTGQAISPERWLLYRLVHSMELFRDARSEEISSERAPSRDLQAYLGETVFADAQPVDAGGLCALDLDWTLERTALGFPSLTPSGAVAVRALARHNYRPVIATGRSLCEVVERCQAYRLAGGVAEYGAYLYVPATGVSRCLLSEADRTKLDEVRKALVRIPDVEVDPAFRGAVRAYWFDPRGHRRSLPATVAQAALGDGGVRAIPGAKQTDFMVSSIDKGTGLRALGEALGIAGDPLLQLAVGDSAEDLPMFGLAREAITLRGSELARNDTRIRVAADAAGAVTSLLGHRPGGCPACRMQVRSGETRLLLELLRIQDARGARKVVHGAHLAAALVSSIRDSERTSWHVSR